MLTLKMCNSWKPNPLTFAIWSNRSEIKHAKYISTTHTHHFIYKLHCLQMFVVISDIESLFALKPRVLCTYSSLPLKMPATTSPTSSMLIQSSAQVPTAISVRKMDTFPIYYSSRYSYSYCLQLPVDKALFITYVKNN